MGLLAFLLTGLAMTAVPSQAPAAELVPCEAEGPGGPIVTKSGQGTLETQRPGRRAMRRSGIRQSLIRPANNLTGRPTFPLGAVRYGARSRIGIKGGLRFRHRGRSLVARGLVAVIPDAKRRPAVVHARFGGGLKPLFRVRGGARNRNAEKGQLNFRNGRAVLTAAAARALNRKLRLKRKRKLRGGTRWARFDLNSTYFVTEPDNPEAETPEEPPVKPEPAGAVPVQGATTIKWHARDTWIDYVNSGAGSSVSDGATADPPSGQNNLVYSFNFPFSSGWTVPGSEATAVNALVKGTGTVGFRYCTNTINFTMSQPEIELDGDQASRIIFRVNGTDGTAFPDSRAVVIKLIPGQAESHATQDNGDGTTTVTYDRIPGFIPVEATGIFAGFYPSYSPDFDGMDPRPDRFGFLSLTYTYPNPAP